MTTTTKIHLTATVCKAKNVFNKSDYHKNSSVSRQVIDADFDFFRMLKDKLTDDEYYNTPLWKLDDKIVGLLECFAEIKNDRYTKHDVYLAVRNFLKSLKDLENKYDCTVTLPKTLEKVNVEVLRPDHQKKQYNDEKSKYDSVLRIVDVVLQSIPDEDECSEKENDVIDELFNLRNAIRIYKGLE